MLVILACLLGSAAYGFSLLGPFASWMDQAKSYRAGDAIGGPMNLNEEYRWNIPVVTYGFDQSFVDYFGVRGIVAVDEAIAIMNDLPPASEVVFSQFPMEASGVNGRAQAQQLLDLKSVAMVALVEQMGLASADRYVFCLRDFSISNNRTNAFVIQRNFDPIARFPSSYVNGTLYWYDIYYSANAMIADAVEVADPDANVSSSVSSGNVYVGQYRTSFTRDDVGGLVYLLSPDNRNVERLPPGSRGVSGSLVNAALRPGVDKVTFRRLHLDPISRQFVTWTNRFMDQYIASGDILTSQLVERVVTRPDIIFAAGDLPFGTDGRPQRFARTDTAHWSNYASLNSGVATEGPGVIEPGIQITFNRDTGYLSDDGFVWGSFAGTTNAPIYYPAGKNTPIILIPSHSDWMFLDDGSDQGVSWTAIKFNDSQWRVGRAKLGYGDGDQATLLGFGTNAENKYVTSYFRRTFPLSDPSDFTNLTISLLRDDGAIVYLNGVEVFRSNMQVGQVDYRTYAAAVVGGVKESVYFVTSINPKFLVEGTNVVAVEVHQESPASPDLGFDLELSTASAPRGPKLEISRSGSAILLRWPSAAQDHRLFSSGALRGPWPWVPFPGTPLDDGTWKSVAIFPNPGSGPQFFQLVDE